jgi:hypothetical protein
MKLSIGEIQDLLRQAGWPEDLIVTAAAVFYYESGGGNTEAHKVDSIERSYGLAQVNTNAWPYSPDQLYDPLFNLQVAYQIYQQQGWRAWANTYYGGRYHQYLAASQAAYDQGSAVIGNSGGSSFPSAPGNVSVATVFAVVASVLVFSLVLDL